tara:strand:- start:297 stop:740 length:444 start_codon:yes stop_codon:yes gene_type:complete
MGSNQLYKLVCCGKVTKTPQGNWDVCHSCGTIKPRIEEVDKEDDVLFVGKQIKTTPSKSVGDTLVGIDLKKNKKGNHMVYKEHALNYLKTQAQADREKALLSLSMLLEHPAGIGDHSTGDLYNNLNEALSALSDADDRLETLGIYFK